MKGGEMTKPIKILHIDPEYKVTYFINIPGVLIHTPISFKKAVKLLKTEEFDLILSEPHNRAILKPKEENMDLLYQNPVKNIEGMERKIAV